jgi:nitrogenase-stabilizing/protective protein
MSNLALQLKQLSAAEDFFEFLGVPFEQGVLDINRLHILKRFFQYMRQQQGLDELDDIEMFKQLRAMLASSYDDFVHSSAAREKVFKVFQDAQHKSVSLDSLKNSLRNSQRSPMHHSPTLKD